MPFLITVYCMVLTALSYFNLDCFLRTYSLKCFHKLKFMTLFILPLFPTPMEMTSEQVYRKFIICHFNYKNVMLVGLDE